MVEYLQRYPSLLLLSISSIILAVLACSKPDDVKKVSLIKVSDDPVIKGEVRDKFRFAVAAVISPEPTFSDYQDMSEYIGNKLNRPGELVQRKTYGEINALLENGNVDAGLICTGAYVVAKDKFGVRLLVVPVMYGQPIYYSYIIVKKESKADSFEDLRGKSFAFSDPFSNSGYFYPSYLLAKMDETPDSFFHNFIFTYSHDNSIYAVADNIVDAAAVDSLIYDISVKRNPPLFEKIKIIQRSPAFAINPIVVPPNIDPKFAERLKEIFINMNQDEIGKKILERLNIDRFVTIDDREYDLTREMLDLIQGKRLAHAQVMKVFEKEASKIIKGLTEGNMNHVYKAGLEIEKLYYKYEGKRDQSDTNRNPTDSSEFDRFDKELHGLARKLAEDARAGQKEAIIRHFALMIETCVSCHEKYRDKS